MSTFTIPNAEVKCPKIYCVYTENGKLRTDPYTAKPESDSFEGDTIVAGKFVPESEYRRLRKIEREYLKIIEDPFWRLNK